MSKTKTATSPPRDGEPMGTQVDKNKEGQSKKKKKKIGHCFVLLDDVHSVHLAVCSSMITHKITNSNSRLQVIDL